jgi:hypothetical protein
LCDPELCSEVDDFRCDYTPVTPPFDIEKPSTEGESCSKVRWQSGEMFTLTPALDIGSLKVGKSHR